MPVTTAGDVTEAAVRRRFRDPIKSARDAGEAVARARVYTHYFDNL